jgi:hypothetical protein
VRYQLQGYPTEKNQWEKKKEETTLPVGRVFPDVSDATHMASLQVAVNRSGAQPASPEGARPLAELPTDAPDRAPSQPDDRPESTVTPKAQK